MDNIEPLLTEEQIEEVEKLERKRITRKDAARLRDCILDFVREEFPEIDPDEHLAEAIKEAYLTGYRRGIEELSGSWIPHEPTLEDVLRQRRDAEVSGCH